MSNTNQPQRESDPLVELLQHPEVRERLNKGILAGLSGHARIDYIIGVVQRAVDDSPLLNLYKQLRSSPEYCVYFPNSARGNMHQSK